MKIEFCDTAAIDQMPDALARLLAVLELDPATVFVSDESNLNDFVGCGLPSRLAERCNTLESLYEMWKDYILTRIAGETGVHLDTTDIPIPELCTRIETERVRTIH